MRKLLLLSVIPLFLVAGCSQEVPLPTGPQRISGLLERAPLSRVRRGTHVLKQQGEEVYYVESTTLNLGTLEGRNVELQGVIEANADREALPVLVAEKVLKGGNEAMRRWVIKALGITLSVPGSWDASFTKDGAVFTASGSLTPALRIRTIAADQLPFSFDAPPTASGKQLDVRVVDRKRAVMVSVPQINQWNVYVDLGGTPRSLLSFVFLLDGQDEAAIQAQVFSQVMDTVRFETSSANRPSTPRAGTGTAVGPGQPCGGTAGILCPPGSYCQVTDRVSGVGRCKQL